MAVGYGGGGGSTWSSLIAAPLGFTFHLNVVSVPAAFAAEVTEPLTLGVCAAPAAARIRTAAHQAMSRRGTGGIPGAGRTGAGFRRGSSGAGQAGSSPGTCRSRRYHEIMGSAAERGRLEGGAWRPMK